MIGQTLVSYSMLLPVDYNRPSETDTDVGLRCVFVVIAIINPNTVFSFCTETSTELLQDKDLQYAKTNRPGRGNVGRVLTGRKQHFSGGVQTALDSSASSDTTSSAPLARSCETTSSGTVERSM